MSTKQYKLGNTREQAMAVRDIANDLIAKGYRLSDDQTIEAAIVIEYLKNKENNAAVETVLTLLRDGWDGTFAQLADVAEALAK